MFSWHVAWPNGRFCPGLLAVLLANWAILNHMVFLSALKASSLFSLWLCTLVGDMAKLSTIVTAWAHGINLHGVS